MGSGGSKSKLVRAVQVTPAPAPVDDNNTSNERDVISLDSFLKMSDDDKAQFIADNVVPFSTSDASALGLNNYNSTQALIHQLSMHEKPIVLDDASFDSQLKANALGGVELYRGLGYDTTGKLVDSVKFGEVQYLGDGVHGNGNYFTTSPIYASGYSGGTPGTSSFTAFIDKSKAKVITESKLERLYRNDTSALKQSISRASVNFDDAMSMYAVAKGYNTIHVPGGNGGTSMAYGKGRTRNGYMDFYVSLDRSTLVIRNTTKVR